MRRRARTVLCGGRSAMVVPTATVISRSLNGRAVRHSNPPIGEPPFSESLATHVGIAGYHLRSAPSWGRYAARFRKALLALRQVRAGLAVRLVPEIGEPFLSVRSRVRREQASATRSSVRQRSRFTIKTVSLTVTREYRYLGASLKDNSSDSADLLDSRNFLPRCPLEQHPAAATPVSNNQVLTVGLNVMAWTRDCSSSRKIALPPFASATRATHLFMTPPKYPVARYRPSGLKAKRRHCLARRAATPTCRSSRRAPEPRHGLEPTSAGPRRQVFAIAALGQGRKRRVRDPAATLLCRCLFRRPAPSPKLPARLRSSAV